MYVKEEETEMQEKQSRILKINYTFCEYVLIKYIRKNLLQNTSVYIIRISYNVFVT